MFSASVSPAAEIGVGTPSAAPRFAPWGGLTTSLRNAVNAGTLTELRWQQAYAPEAFGPDPIRILGVEFPALPAGDQAANAALLFGDYEISLSSTTRPVDMLLCPTPTCDGQGLLGDFDDNLGSDLTVIESSLSLSSAFVGDTLVFSGPAFDYDPGLGLPLLVDVRVTGFANSNDLTMGFGNYFFEATADTLPGGDCQTNTVDVWGAGENSCAAGLVTAFLVPEPGPFALVLLGLLGVAIVRRRR